MEEEREVWVGEGNEVRGRGWEGSVERERWREGDGEGEGQKARANRSNFEFCA